MNIADFITPFRVANPNAGVGNAIQARGLEYQHDLGLGNLAQRKLEHEQANQLAQQQLWMQGMEFNQRQDDKAMAAFGDYLKLLQSGQPEQAATMLPYLQGLGVDITHPGGVGQGPAAPSVPTYQQPEANRQAGEPLPKQPQPSLSFQDFYKAAISDAPADLQPQAPAPKPKKTTPLLDRYMSSQAPSEMPSDAAPPDDVQQEMRRQEQAGVPLPGMPLPDVQVASPKQPKQAAPVAAPKPAPVAHQAAAAHAAAVQQAPQQAQSALPPIHASYRGRDLGWVDPNAPQQRQQADASRIAGVVTEATPEKYQRLSEALKAAKTPEEAIAITKAFVEPIIEKMIGSDAALKAAGVKSAGQAQKTERLDFRAGVQTMREAMNDRKTDASKNVLKKLQSAREALKEGSISSLQGIAYTIAQARDPGAIVTKQDFEAAVGKTLVDKVWDFFEGNNPVAPTLNPMERKRIADQVELWTRNTLRSLEEDYQEAQVHLGDFPEGDFHKGGESVFKSTFGGLPFYKKSSGPAASTPEPATTSGPTATAPARPAHIQKLLGGRP